MNKSLNEFDYFNETTKNYETLKVYILNKSNNRLMMVFGKCVHIIDDFRTIVPLQYSDNNWYNIICYVDNKLYFNRKSKFGYLNVSDIIESRVKCNDGNDKLYFQKSYYDFDKNIIKANEVYDNSYQFL